MNDQKQITGFLQSVPLFSGVSVKKLEQLAARMVERDYAAGQHIVTQGMGGEGFFILIGGKAEAYRERTGNSKLLVNTFVPTNFFGELALLDDGPRTASVVAAEPTKCLVLTRWDFLGVLRDGDAEMAVTILQEMAKRFRLALDAM